MKRFVVALLTLGILLSPAAALAKAAPKITSVDAKAIVGMTEKALKAKYGNPSRTEPSEYGFSWYVYSSDLSNYFLAGVKGGKVVALYTNAKTQQYGSTLKLGTTKTAARKALGTPTTYVRNGDTVLLIPNKDQKDLFTVGSNYVIAFYDLTNSNKVTSVMVVPKADEDKAMVSHPALSASVVAAYQRINSDLVNAIRVRNGLKALTNDAQDAKLALARSTDMKKRNYFSHYTPEGTSPFQQARKMGIKFSSMGENIAYGNRNAILAFESFMNSSSHRNIIMAAKYTKLGTGVVYGGSRYVLVTNIFSK